MVKAARCICMMCIVLLWTSCTPLLKKTYHSVNEYPVPKGDFVEMDYTSSHTTFSFWSPAADEVRLMLFRDGSSGHAYRTVHMLLGENGIWTVVVDGNLRNQFYTFNVKIKDKWHGDTPGMMPYAVSMNGRRSAIIDMLETDPKGWESDTRPALRSATDVVIYNLHYRDFSNDTTSGIRNRGKFLALTERGTHTSDGMTTGIDHLKELGITHVQLMPSFDYNDIDEGNVRHPHYAYGSTPLNFTVPEGSYSTRPNVPSARINEFKQMVMALHRAGVRVIMEMSFNHVPDAATSNLERAVPGYFFRMTGKNYADGSGFGNEIASERPMARKLIVETIRHWINEYHVDGFYFDMMGLTDLQTMRDVRAAADDVDPSILIYGDGTSPKKAALGLDSLAVTANMYRIPGVGAYSHELRNALLGPDKEIQKTGFLGGLPGNEETIRFTWAGAIPNRQIKFYRVHDCKRPWAAQPTQMMAYVSSHNDYCLVDRLRAAMEITPIQQIRLAEVAMTTLLTSQGTPILFNGDEILRDKHFVRNSMHSSDSINDIKWQLKRMNYDLFTYVKGLISLRHHHPAFRLGNAALVRQHLQYLPSDPNTLAFMLSNHAGGDSWGTIIVLLNTGLRYTKITVPEGSYTVVCDNGKVDEGGISRRRGPQVGVAGQSALIMWKE
jgi:pullulanase